MEVYPCCEGIGSDMKLASSRVWHRNSLRHRFRHLWEPSATSRQSIGTAILVPRDVFDVEIESWMYASHLIIIVFGGSFAGRLRGPSSVRASIVK